MHDFCIQKLANRNVFYRNLALNLSCALSTLVIPMMSVNILISNLFKKHIHPEYRIVNPEPMPKLLKTDIYTNPMNRLPSILLRVFPIFRIQQRFIVDQSVHGG
jgi:hypothetical protein